MGTSLIRNGLPLGTYSRTMPRVGWGQETTLPQMSQVLSRLWQSAFRWFPPHAWHPPSCEGGEGVRV